MTSQPRSLLLLGTVNTEGTVSKLKSLGLRYDLRRLESRPSNWAKITDTARAPSTIAVIGKLTSTTLRLLNSADYEHVGQQLFEAIAQKPHLLFVYEENLWGANPGDSDKANSAHAYEELHLDEEEETYIQYVLSQPQYRAPDEKTREAVFNLLQSWGITYLPYRTNAELTTLAQRFIEESDGSLLLRVYVPTGRLYSVEAERLLALFRDFLNQVGKRRVRQDGYSTTLGKTYEFYGEAKTGGSISDDLERFSEFLDQCIADPFEAEVELAEAGFSESQAAELVTRYKRDARRLKIDMKHRRENQLMKLRQEFERDTLELMDDQGLTVSGANTSVSSLVASATALSLPSDASSIVINQQIFNSPVERAIMQSLQGHQHLGAEALQLLDLIREEGGVEAARLETSLLELEDDDAPVDQRLMARQRLKKFLFEAGKKVGFSTLAVAQKYVESRMGLS